MTNNNTSGNVPQTIDSNGNVISRPYGSSRWAAPRFYKCGHEACGYPSQILSTSGTAHNCCTAHSHKEGAE